jgi:hypothetical protein
MRIEERRWASPLLTFPVAYSEIGSLDSAVGTGTDYSLDGRGGVGFRVPVRERFFSSSCRPDQYCGPHSFLFVGYRRPFSRGNDAGV